MSRLWKDLTASRISWFLMIVFALCAVLLCCIGIWSIAASTAAQSGDGEELDAAGLEQGSAFDTENTINISQLPDNSFIYDISIEELDSADTYMDAQTVQVVGEVVGDRIYAEGEPGYCWIVLQSIGESDAEVSVFMNTASSELIDTYGAYGKRGTRLQVGGVFNLACKDHHGTSELHATSVSVVEKGEVESLPFRPVRMSLGLLLIMAGCVILLVYNVLSERQR